MAKGYLALILHSHLPYVRHPEYPECLEEEWLFQAVTECYAPLLFMLRELERDGVPFRLALSFSPPLCEMLRDELLRERCTGYVASRLELAEKELRRTGGTPYFPAARMYRDHYRRLWDDYVERDGCELLAGFTRLAREGAVELMTTTATHALLPLVATAEARRVQVEAGCRSFREHFGFRPRGMWLPECAYQPGVEDLLAASNVRAFFVDSHAALLARPTPTAGVFRPFRAPSGPVAFARDADSSREVWSCEEGYPGHPAYREFYRDVGHDADYQYVRPYLHRDGVRRNLGLKYHRITGRVGLDRKEPYDPAAARRKAEEHGRDFVRKRTAQVRRVRPHTDAPPVVVAPYDTELFGHRWLEGLKFLESVFRTVAGSDELALTTPSRYLEYHPPEQRCRPGTSSWGYGGYFELWINATNDWIYPRLHRAEEQMVGLARAFPSPTPLQKRALDQCARELVLAQASDWPFLMSVHSFEDYARGRITKHLQTFRTLRKELYAGAVDEEFLSRVEDQDGIFRGMDYSLFADSGTGAKD